MGLLADSYSSPFVFPCTHTQSSPLSLKDSCVFPRTPDSTIIDFSSPPTDYPHPLPTLPFSSNDPTPPLALLPSPLLSLFPSHNITPINFLHFLH